MGASPTFSSNPFFEVSTFSFFPVTAFLAHTPSSKNSLTVGMDE